mmetsp:Transcript_5285/g.13237  ORF Transcript_5285/g.13237 Transcript_5285/m.13237 type:complete len:347 (-) Transcript_5285:341-1381(-)
MVTKKVGGLNDGAEGDGLLLGAPAPDDRRGHEDDDEDGPDDDPHHGRAHLALVSFICLTRSAGQARPFEPPGGTLPRCRRLAAMAGAKVEVHDDGKVVRHKRRVVSVEDFDTRHIGGQLWGEQNVVDLRVLDRAVHDVVAVPVPPVGVPLVLLEALHRVHQVGSAIRVRVPQNLQHVRLGHAALDVEVLVGEVVEVAEDDDLVAFRDGGLDRRLRDLGLALALGAAVWVLGEGLKVQAVHGDCHAVDAKVRDVVLAQGRPLAAAVLVPALAALDGVRLLVLEPIERLAGKHLGQHGHVLLRRRVDAFLQQRPVLGNVRPRDQLPQDVAVLDLHQVQDVRVQELHVL